MATDPLPWNVLTCMSVLFEVIYLYSSTVSVISVEQCAPGAESPLVRPAASSLGGSLQQLCKLVVGCGHNQAQLLWHLPGLTLQTGAPDPRTRAVFTVSSVDPTASLPCSAASVSIRGRFPAWRFTLIACACQSNHVRFHQTVNSHSAFVEGLQLYDVIPRKMSTLEF